ncbi:MAG: GerMN domain-containing protein [Defluviitaleaceae bacterium]|nr:GerMN domain-containing protein [Defluviitaleaceae bacterium]
MSKNKKNQRNNARIIVGIIAFAALIGLGILVYLAPWQNDEQIINPPPPQDEETDPEYIDIAFYFLNNSGLLEQEIRNLEKPDEGEFFRGDIVHLVLIGLHEGPQTAGLSGVIPEGVNTEFFSFLRGDDEGVLQISFSPEFYEISLSENIILISSFVYTFTQFDFIEHIEFLVGEEPLLDSHGAPFGRRNRGNTILDITLIEPQTTTVTLYFPDRQAMWLFPEQRVVRTDNVGSIEEAIVNELLRGPMQSNLTSAFPSDVTLMGVSVESAISSVTVNFTPSFLNMGGSTAETMAIFALVNSLTERPLINRVQIQIDGLIVTDTGNMHTDISRPIERDEDLIQE